MVVNRPFWNQSEKSREWNKEPNEGNSQANKKSGVAGYVKNLERGIILFDNRVLRFGIEDSFLIPGGATSAHSPAIRVTFVEEEAVEVFRPQETITIDEQGARASTYSSYS